MLKPIVVFIFIFLSFQALAQQPQGCISGTYSTVNAKVRIQYEYLIEGQYSGGVNLNYYLLNWQGPVVEPFIRVYGKRYGNKEGFFAQLKLIYGNLSSLKELYDGNYIMNKRFSTFGVGASAGYKFLIGKDFVIEPLAGIRFLTPPQTKWVNITSEQEALNKLGEGIGWYLATGFPLDFQLKFGYQF